MLTEGEHRAMVDLTHLNEGMLFVPDLYVTHVMNIDFQTLSERMGVRHGIFDVDNTLVNAGENELPEEIAVFLQGVVKNGYLDNLHFASNSRRKGLEKLAKSIGATITIPGLINRKPSERFFKKILDETGYKPQETVMVGDMITTDIYGAKRLGIRTVLVESIGSHALLNQLQGVVWRESSRQKKLRAILGKNTR